MKIPKPKDKVVSIKREYYSGFVVPVGNVLRVVDTVKDTVKDTDMFLGSDGIYHINGCYERYKNGKKRRVKGKRKDYIHNV